MIVIKLISYYRNQLIVFIKINFEYLKRDFVLYFIKKLLHYLLS